MPWSADDIAALIDPDLPGYVVAVVDGVSVGGLFRNDYIEPLGMSGSAPSLLLASADAGSVVAGTTTVTIDGASYTVVKSAPDGSGLTRLTLEEA